MKPLRREEGQWAFFPVAVIHSFAGRNLCGRPSILLLLSEHTIGSLIPMNSSYCQSVQLCQILLTGCIE